MKLDHIPAEDKAAAFDALVREFQGKGRFVAYRSRTKEIKEGPYESRVTLEKVPIYEFVMRVEGHDDFAASVLALLPSKAT